MATRQGTIDVGEIMVEATFKATLRLRDLVDAMEILRAFKVEVDVDQVDDEDCPDCGSPGMLVCPLCDQVMDRAGLYWICVQCNLMIDVDGDRMAPYNIDGPGYNREAGVIWMPLAKYHDDRPDAEAATDWIPGVKFDKDGDQWMCAGLDFEDLHKSPAGFGPTRVEAYKAYLLDPDVEKPAGTCRVCGCTESTACQDFDDDGNPQPCHWVAGDLCSACAREGKNNAGLDNQ